MLQTMHKVSHTRRDGKSFLVFPGKTANETTLFLPAFRIFFLLQAQTLFGVIVFVAGFVPMSAYIPQILRTIMTQSTIGFLFPHRGKWISVPWEHRHFFGDTIFSRLHFPAVIILPCQSAKGLFIKNS